MYNQRQHPWDSFSVVSYTPEDDILDVGAVIQLHQERVLYLTVVWNRQYN
jgi:hypothetical protein